MLFKSGDKNLEVYFLQEHHFQLLNSHKLELSQLPYLPQFPSIADEDVLDWLKYQRAVEKQYCGFKSTTYDYASVITIGDINRKGVVYKAKYDEVLNADSSIQLGQNFYFHFFNGKLFILNSNNTVNNPMFTRVQGDLASSLYQALLSAYNVFESYFRDNKELTKTVAQRKFIDLGFVIQKAAQ
jgi:hypothetical protein